MARSKIKSERFDCMLQNPFYDGNKHIDTCLESIDVLSDDGQMIIIEPSTFLINLLDDGLNNDTHRLLRNKLNGIVKEITIVNLNNAMFGLGSAIPMAIMNIDKGYNSNEIKFNCFGDVRTVHDIEDCNLIGPRRMVRSILNKAKSYGDMASAHVYDPLTSHTDACTRYVQVPMIMRCGCGDPLFTDEGYVNGYYKCYYWWCYNNVVGISDTPIRELKKGRRYSDPSDDKFSDTLSTNLYDDAKKIENYAYYIMNNSLPLFISICISINMHNRVLGHLPWIVDAKHTDAEIYDMLNINAEEQRLIEMTLEKYKRTHPWFDNYIRGV